MTRRGTTRRKVTEPHEWMSDREWLLSRRRALSAKLSAGVMPGNGDVDAVRGALSWWLPVMSPKPSKGK